MRKAIVMAGGMGSRLSPLTLVRPKPLAPVANRPVLAHILEWLREHGISEVLMTLHYRADDIRNAFGDGRSLGLAITYRVEDAPLGTAGSVKFAEDWIGEEPFLIASGDALTDLDLGTLVRRHREAGAWLTLGLQRVPDPSAYGVVELDGHGKVRRFQEKPGSGQAFSNLVNTGIYCVEPQVLAAVPHGRACDWSREVFPRLLAEGKPLFGQELSGYWCDIGSVSEYRRGQRDALERSVRLSLPAIELCDGLWVGPGASIEPGARITGPVLLGAGCRIDAGARIGAGSVIGEGTLVERGALLSGAVVGIGCRIGARAVLRDCVLDDETCVGAGGRVAKEAVVGRGSRLMPGARIDAEARIAPDTCVDGGMLRDWARAEAPTIRPSRRAYLRPFAGALVPTASMASAGTR